MPISLLKAFARRRAIGVAALCALCALGALTACLGDIVSSRGVAGEAAIDLRGFRAKSQVGSGIANAVQSARFVVYLVTGSTRRAVASRVFTAQELDAADSENGTTFTLTFPYSSADDKFEVEGWGMSAAGETLYAVGPIPFTMRAATTQGGQATVSTVAAPVYVGPGRTAAKLVITPRPVATSEGTSVSLTPTLYDASGVALSSATFRFSWSSGDGNIARFGDARVGVVTGGPRPGSTWIYARFDDIDLRDSVIVTNTVPAAQVRITGGQNQTAATGTTLPQPVAVQVLSAGGQPVPGVSVGFAVTSGGGSVNAATRVTGTDGNASVSWTLGATVGTQQMTVSVTGIAPVVVSAVATQAVPSATKSSISVLPTAILVGGDEAVVTAVLRNASGAPMPGIAATFSGSTALTFTTASGVSDDAGKVTTRVQASDPGTMAISVVVSGQTIASTSLQVGARQGTPASISVVSGDNQTVRVGTTFPSPLVVVVKDASGRPVSGALVDWAADFGDGRKVTDANGESSADYFLSLTWPLGPSTVSVTVTGYGLTATFKFTAVP